jgi:hypothetical protein
VGENKKILNASRREFDGIKFKSELEVMIYKTLKESGFNPFYEPTTYTLWRGFRPTVPFYDKDKKTKLLKLNLKKVIDIKHTPDFVFLYNNVVIVIEAKGMENDVFYIKKKLFRAYLEDLYRETGQKSMYFEIFTKKQLLEAIEIIKGYGTSGENKKINSVPAKR